MNLFRKSSVDKAIDPVLALKAAKQIYLKAKTQGTKAAVAGGLAMQIYGFTRATKDIDVVASGLLDIVSSETLEFGGEIYRFPLEESSVEIDWIVRSDDKKLIYEEALKNAEMTEHGFPVITPEWMVLIKYLAGRGKHQIDLMWLLQEPAIVDRGMVIKIVEDLMGPMAFWAKQDLESVFAEADFRAEREKDQ